MSIRQFSNVERHFGNVLLENIITYNLCDKNGNNVLHTCIFYDDVNRFYISSLNIFNNAKNNKGNTALHLACARGDVFFVEMIINKSNINIHEVNNDGNTPLDVAILFKHKEIIILLVTYFYVDEQKKFNDKFNDKINDFFNEEEINFMDEIFNDDKIKIE